VAAAATAAGSPPPGAVGGAVPAPPTARIFGGTVTPPNAVPPFLAHFTTGASPPRLLCAGVLITARHVLTVASCPIVRGTTVRLGTVTLGAGGQAFSVASVAVPPYRDAATVPVADNVAVVTFAADPIWSADRLATFGIVPATLDGGDGRRGGRGNPQPPGGQAAQLWGWGTAAFLRENPLRPPGQVGPVRLRSATAVVSEAEVCSALFASAGGTRPFDVFCAKSAGQGPCDGDVGTGLASNAEGGGPNVHGLYSVVWSSPVYRCVPSFPQGYTAIRRHADWIRGATAPRTVKFVDK